ncbi:MAG: hypothetical protein J6P89_00150 [Oscillospiraceae bacterium]|nr:hypothetical protein [Oscillospiraceae bacterium]
MALGIYRSLSSTFWTDPKVAEFSAEDRYMMLYLLTNPRTTLAGTLELNYRQIAFEIGHSVESAVCIIRRLDEKHKVIMLSEGTNEILIRNWYKYNWAGGSPKVLTSVKNVAKWVKNPEFKAYILDKISEFEKRKEAKENKLTNTYTDTYTETDTDTDTEVSIGYRYPIDTLSDKTTEQEDKPKRKKFVKPSVDDVLAYCRERSNQVDPQRFYDYYESNGWKVGKNTMKDWKAAVRTWERNDYSGNSRGSDPFDVRYQQWDESDPTVH